MNFLFIKTPFSIKKIIIVYWIILYKISKLKKFKFYENNLIYFLFKPFLYCIINNMDKVIQKYNSIKEIRK